MSDNSEIVLVNRYDQVLLEILTSVVGQRGDLGHQTVHKLLAVPGHFCAEPRRPPFSKCKFSFSNGYIFVKSFSNNLFDHSKSIRKCQRIQKSY